MKNRNRYRKYTFSVSRVATAPNSKNPEDQFEKGRGNKIIVVAQSVNQAIVRLNLCVNVNNIRLVNIEDNDPCCFFGKKDVVTYKEKYKERYKREKYA